MNRTTFLQLSMLMPLVTTAGAMREERAKKGFKVEAGKDRYQEELQIMGGRFSRIVSADDTNGDLCIYDTVRYEKGGPAFHLHHQQDEWFYVLSGEFIVKVADETFSLKPGDSAFGPRTIPHAFSKTSEGEGHMLVLFQPAGSMEHFFKEMSKLGSSIPKDQERTLKKLWSDHQMEIVGPPLQF
jgi:mannose-6-phosphate isomerase-like protein (cupin superfamily)